jgi:hypothetical protein
MHRQEAAKKAHVRGLFSVYANFPFVQIGDQDAEPFFADEQGLVLDNVGDAPAFWVWFGLVWFGSVWFQSPPRYGGTA